MENPREFQASQRSYDAGRPSLAARRRILVVDDNLDFAHSMTQLLRAMGHEADYAINATVALTVAKTFRPDTILLDITLPDGDGRLLADELRREIGLDNIRIVCVTGRSQEDPRRSIQAGCDAHYVKPLDRAEIEKLLG
jgi:DNA-binding response OmpR family regulator